MSTGNEPVNASNVRALWDYLWGGGTLKSLRKALGLGDTLGVLPPECGGTGVTYADGNMYAYFDTIPTLYAGTSVKRVVHQSAKEIDENAFKDCTKLTEVVAPSVTKIGGSAFSGCTSLASF